MTAWELLGLEPTHDIRAIKRAYSVKLKTTRPDDDAQAYQQLREAYDWAQDYVKICAEHGVDEPAVEQQAPIPETDAVLVVAPFHTAESILRSCNDVWVEHGSAGLLKAWPWQQALLEALPLADRDHASRAFAQFVVEQPDLPVEVIVALTLHFQWGLDFRVDQILGRYLAQALCAQLNAADVFTVVRPERQVQYAWPLALAKLWDEKRGLWVRLLAAGLDCPTRKQILNARLSTLQALGVSREAAVAMQDVVAKGGKLQGVIFTFLVVGALAFLHRPGFPNLAFVEVAGLGLGAVLAYFFLYDMLRSYQSTLRNVRTNEVQVGVAWFPAVASFFIYSDQTHATLFGYSNHYRFLIGVGGIYLAIWLAALTDEDPWCELLLPIFGLLTFSVREYFPEINLALLISLTFAWTMGSHLVMRGYPQGVEWVYSQLIKMGLLKTVPVLFLAILFFGVAWVWIAVALLPILLFRMAEKYRLLYCGTAIYVGVLLGSPHNLEGQTHGFPVGVLATVICIQVLQALSQKLADYGLKQVRWRV